MSRRPNLGVFLVPLVGSLLIGVDPVPAAISPQASPVVLVLSTGLSGDLGLRPCDDVITHGCIEDVWFDGQLATLQSATIFEVFNTPASFVIAGGVYPRYCRLEDGTKQRCQFAYLQITSKAVFNLPSVDFDRVQVRFRPALDREPEFRIGSAVVNGDVIGFTPAGPGGDELVDITVEATEVQLADCYGLQFAVSNCPDTTVSKGSVSDRVGILLIPGVQSTIFPAEVEEGCPGPADPSGCWVAVVEPETYGFWFDTNASFSGPATTNPINGAAEFLIGGPHFLPGTDPTTATVDDLNLGRFRYYASTSYWEKLYGLTPAEVDPTNLPVRRLTSNSDPNRLRVDHVVDYQVSGDGGLVTVSNVSFSTATMSVERVITLERNQLWSIQSFLTEAGLGSALAVGPYGLEENQDFLQVLGSLVRFTRTGNFTVTAFYSTSPSVTQDRAIRVIVVEPKPPTVGVLVSAGLPPTA